jgi:hypothetical protein
VIALALPGRRRGVLNSIFSCARDFGLTADEAWAEIDRCLTEVGEDATVGEYLDELNAALAASILAKQRRTLSEQPPSSRASRSADTGQAARRG